MSSLKQHLPDPVNLVVDGKALELVDTCVCGLPVILAGQNRLKKIAKKLIKKLASYIVGSTSSVLLKP